MYCPRCSQLILSRIGYDEDGERHEEDYCPSCGWCKVLQPVGKPIEVRKGEYYR